MKGSFSTLIYLKHFASWEMDHQCSDLGLITQVSNNNSGENAPEFYLQLLVGLIDPSTSKT